MDKKIIYYILLFLINPFVCWFFVYSVFYGVEEKPWFIQSFMCLLTTALFLETIKKINKFETLETKLEIYLYYSLSGSAVVFGWGRLLYLLWTKIY